MLTPPTHSAQLSRRVIPQPIAQLNAWEQKNLVICRAGKILAGIEHEATE